ncbi:TonB-dependent receptor [Ornithobacterium rhinotracheale]|uniref:TonB-dependent receptor n=1 Tax=Ornithobacterium rhinotracheale TaxID=28251 RepID=UPI00129C3E70|nr:TonB-dependent receptor [Ornithobacterium rhinotracheale]MRI63866.1 TonB-dependent receptor [Ornithobacterium rhinotracheale]
MYKHSKFLCLIFSILCASGLNAAQITGRVIEYGKAIRNAKVSLLQTSNSTLTNDKGRFSLVGVEYGEYTLQIALEGYQTKELKINVDKEVVDLGDITIKDDFLLLDKLVVTATRNEVLRKDAPIVCNLLDDRILHATQSVTLSEGLNFQPALRMEDNCQNCGFNSLRMNGLEGAYSQILIDGRPIYNSLQGVYGLEQIPANMIDRVEVVRSGGSALYGSSAIAGTVNIITKEPINDRAYLSTNQAYIGGKSADRTYMAGADVVTESNSAGLSINGFSRQRAHWDSNDDGYSEIGDLKANSFNAKAYYKPSKLSKITFNGYSIYEFRRGGNKFDKPFHEADITESTTHNILNGGITYEQYTRDRNHKFSTYLDVQNLKRDSYYGAHKDLNAYGNSEDNTFIAGMQYTGNIKIGNTKSNTIVTGFEYNRNNLKDNAPAYERFIDQTAEQFGFYFQDVWDVNSKLNLLIGGRLDKHNLIDDPIFSPRANVLFKVTDNTQLRFGYAKGFRAPQVFDEDLHITQIGGEGAVIRNQKDLKPENSNAWSASLDYNRYIGNWSVGLAIDGFYTKLKDVFILEEIGNATNGDLLKERRNGPGATIKGFTINPKVQFKNIFNFQLGATFQTSEYDEAVQWSESVPNTSKRFFRTPDKYGFYVLTYKPMNMLSVNFSGVYTSSMIAQHFEGYIGADKLETTPSFFENNFKIEYKIPLKDHMSVSINGGIQNYNNAYQKDFDLGEDRDSAYIYGPGRPRTYFMGLNFSL